MTNKMSVTSRIAVAIILIGVAIVAIYAAIALANRRQPVEKPKSAPPLKTTVTPSLPATPPPATTQTTNAAVPGSRTGLIPLTEMSATDNYKGEDGGLYGGGQNEPPAALREAAQKEAAKIVPLDADGKPSPNGKIVLLSLGMSHTTQEFVPFKAMADKDPAKSPNVVLVDGAQVGRDATYWNEIDGGASWRNVDQRITSAGVTAQQVQAVWMKHVMRLPHLYGNFPGHVEELKKQTISSLNIAKRRFPNLRIAFLSSRIYAGYAIVMFNPEPFAYETAFVVRRLIQDQIKGNPLLNWDPSRGEVNAPLLLWGPYLWADGLTPRKSDGLIFKPEDFEGDGTHPSVVSGRAKVARILLNFFKTDPYARVWFLKSPAR